MAKSLAWAALAIDLVFIIFGPLPLKVIFSALLLNNVLALFWTRPDPFVLVDGAGIAIHGMGKMFAIRYEEVESIGSPPALDPISRTYQALVRIRWPGFGFNQNVQVRLRGWRLAWITLPFPPLAFPVITRSVRLVLPEPAEFTKVIQSNVRRVVAA